MCHFWISAGLAVLELAAPRAAAPAPADRLLAAAPADPLVVVSVANLDDLRKRADANAWVRLCRDDAVRPFFAHFGAMMDRARADALGDASEPERALADPSAWCAALHGGVLGVATASPSTGQPAAGLFVERAEPSAALDKLVDGLLDVLEENPDCIPSTGEHAGVELRLFEERLPADSDDSAAIVAFFQCAGVQAVVFGNERESALELAHGAIDRLSGSDGSAGFGASDRLAEARAAAGHGHALELLVDVGGLIAAVERADAERANTAEDLVSSSQPKRVLDRVGLSGMRWVYSAADVGEDETLDWSMVAHLPPGSLLAEAAALLGPAPRALLALAPPEALGAGIGHFDLNGLYQLVLRSVKELAPDEYPAMRGAIDAAKQEFGLDFEADLLAQLTGDFASINVRIPREEVPAMVADMVGDEGTELLTQGAAVVVGLKDAAVVEAFVDQALELGGLQEMVETEEFQGRWIQRLDMPGQMILWSFSEKQFVFGQSPTAIRTALSRLGSSGGASLAADPRYQAALSRHASSSLLSIADSRVSAEAILGSVGMLSAMMQMGMGMEDQGDEVMGWLQELAEGPAPDPTVAGRYLDGVLVTSIEVRGDTLRVHYSAR